MTDYKMCSAGKHVAILNRYITAGIHTMPGYQGAPAKDIPQVILNWEIMDEDMEEGKPYWFRTFGVGNVSDYDTEKSKKTSLFSSMFPDYDMTHKNAHTYLGEHCYLFVKHNPGRGKHEGKTFANFDKVFPCFEPKPTKELSQPVVHFDFYNPTQESWEQLKPFEQDFIKQAKDYPGSKLATMLGDVEDTDNEQPNF